MNVRPLRRLDDSRLVCMRLPALPMTLQDRDVGGKGEEEEEEA